MKRLFGLLPPTMVYASSGLLSVVAIAPFSFAADIPLPQTRTMPRVTAHYQRYPFPYDDNRQTPAWANGVFPVENFQSFTSYFGWRENLDGEGDEEFHYGLDMAAPEGSAVLNWWEGRVIEISDEGNCGTSIVVESGAWTHRYCHLQGQVEVYNGLRYLVDPEGGVQLVHGQGVQTGERIGSVGMTGRTTGPHLHWALQYHGNWVDPLVVVQAMADGYRVMNSTSGIQKPIVDAR